MLNGRLGQSAGTARGDWPAGCYGAEFWFQPRSADPGAAQAESCRSKTERTGDGRLAQAGCRRGNASRGIRRAQVGKDLVENGALALLLVSLGIVGYSVAALRMEVRSVCDHRQPARRGHHPRLLFILPVGILAVCAGSGAGGIGLLGKRIGGVFDRIRENFRTMRKAEVAEIIDNAITRTMSRTIITHGCTQMMVGAMLFLAARRCTTSRWR